jgi:hypothetical protein
MKCRGPRRLANRVPKRSTLPSRPLQLARLYDRRARPKKREEQRWQRKRSKPGRSLAQGSKDGFEAAKRSAFRSLAFIHDSPLSIRIQPANNHERGPSRVVSMAVHHGFGNLASARLRGIKTLVR